MRAVAVVTLLAGCTTNQDGAAAPQVDPLTSMLLSETEVNAIVAPVTLTNTFTYRKLFNLDGRTTYTPPECLAVEANTMAEVFEGSGFQKVRGVKLDADEGGADLDQGVVEFDTPAAARAFVAKTVQTWQRCAGSVLTVTDEDKPPWRRTMLRPETVDGVESGGVESGGGESDGVESVGVESDSGYVSTHAMRVVGNVVVDVRASNAGVSEHAVAVVNAIAGRNTL